MFPALSGFYLPVKEIHEMLNHMNIYKKCITQILSIYIPCFWEKQNIIKNFNFSEKKKKKKMQ